MLNYETPSFRYYSILSTLCIFKIFAQSKLFKGTFTVIKTSFLHFEYSKHSPFTHIHIYLHSKRYQNLHWTYLMHQTTTQEKTNEMIKVLVEQILLKVHVIVHQLPVEKAQDMNQWRSKGIRPKSQGIKCVSLCLPIKALVVNEDHLVEHLQMSSD